MYKNVYRCLKWIIEKFMEKKYLTLNDLNELWVKEEDLSDGLEMRRKTFYNHRKALKEKFGIDICQRDEGYAYYIRNPEIIRNTSTDHAQNTSLIESTRRFVSLEMARSL